MIVKNIGNKIINIGSNAVMPDCQIKTGKGVKKNPAIAALVEKGYIKLVDEDEEVEPSPAEKLPAKEEVERDVAEQTVESEGSEDAPALDNQTASVVDDAPKRAKKSSKRTVSASEDDSET